MDAVANQRLELLSQKLRDAGVVDDAALRRAYAAVEKEDLSLDQAIMRLGLAQEDDVLPVMAEVYGYHFFDDLTDIEIDADRTAKLTLPFCESKLICPVRIEGGSQIILTTDPSKPELKEELRFFLSVEPKIAVASTRAIRSLLGHSKQTDDPISPPSSPLQDVDVEALRQSSADGPVIRFVAETFNEAVALGASDVHFEAQEDGLRIRIRINGLLQLQRVDNQLAPSSILARVKVLANMSVSERRLPQDGRITSNIAGRKVDFRVSSVPTSFGESIVCRILDPKSLRLGWEKLGFEPPMVSRIIEMIERPSGLFIVTGPTGSGKTTTLYTALAHLNQFERKILTVEDPIEYNLAGIEQVQVHEEIGMTFASALRSFLRQDPNIIMVGEIRDEQTAEIACRAAMVGRMVLSTVHTSNPEQVVNRLVDLGVPEIIVRDVLIGALGQKLEIKAGYRILVSELWNA